MNQKEGTFNAVTEVMGEIDGAFVPTKEQRIKIIALITSGIMNQEITYRKDHTNVVEVKTYANGLLSNYLAKDSRLNGNVKYEVKNPGSRAGNTDPTIKEMRKLKANLIAAGQTDQIKVIDEAIAKRVSELSTKAPVKKVIKVDMDKIPEELKVLLGNLPSQN